LKVQQRNPQAFTETAQVKAGQKMAKKSLKVDRKKFEGIVQNLLQSKPVKRENVKVKNPKNREKLIPPQK
jgi:hypothetical protein